MPGSTTLLTQQESAADAYYGFPQGTMQALGMSESSNGTNMGTLGNIFQVVPSTAANPGYGLSGVNGNSPMSVGAYLSALVNKTGSVAGGINAYQDWAANGGAPNSIMSQFLSSLGGSGALGPVAQLTAGADSLSSLFTSPNSSSGGQIGQWTGIALRVGAVVLALILLALGIAALALKDSPQGVAATVVKAATA